MSRGWRKARPEGLRSRVLRFALIVLVCGSLALPLMAGTASAQPIPPPSGFSTDNGFMQVEYDGLFSTGSVTAGSTVYADLLQLQFINYIGARSITVTAYQNATDGSPPLWNNVTLSVASRTWTDGQITLTSTSIPRLTTLCADGGCMVFVHQTPVVLIPITGLTQGTFDLYVLVVGLEFLAGIAVATIAAYGVMQRALWAPRPRVIWILPHVMVAFVLLIAVSAPQLTFILAGYAFFGWAPFASIGYFVWVQHLFNKAEGCDIRRLNPRPRHGVDANAMTVALATAGDGSVVVMDKTWTGWLSRIRGFHIKVYGPSEPGREPPAIISLRPFPGQRWRPDPMSRRKVEEELPEDVHELINVYYEEVRKISLPNRNAPRLLAFVESDQPWTVGRYVIRWTKLHTYEPELGPDGQVIRQREPRRRASLPHFEGDGVATLQLAPWHLVDAVVQALIFMRTANVFRRLSAVNSTLNATLATYRTEADVEAAKRSLEYPRMEAEERVPLEQAEAEEIAEMYRRAENRHAGEGEGDKTDAALGKLADAVKKAAKR
jgi:hypothetical protein